MALALDENGDIDLNSAGLPHFIGGRDEAVQRLRVRFRFFRGEWYRDQRLGMPWFEVVFVKAPNPVHVRSLFRQLILGVPGVTRINRLSETLDRASRVLRPSFGAAFEDGSEVTDERVLGESFSPLEVS
ncbi:MAG: hypothetical protein GWO40_18325 [Gammaproteobacteria bacterium]|nr:hypothetical protein [Gammaproteobacteria bacterium]NIX87478.1 hypothetical protein [Gammaproteobacteria bacterium]